MNRLALVLMLLCGQAWGATYYIDPDVDDGGSGTQVSPYNQYSDISALADGDTVYVKSRGVLREAIAIDNVDNFTIGVYGGTAPFEIDSESTRNVGLEIQNSSGWQVRDAYVHHSLDNNIVVRCDSSNTCTFTQPAFLRVEASYACPVVAAGTEDNNCIGFLIIGQNATGLTTCCGVYSGLELRTVTAQYNGGMGVHHYHSREATGTQFRITTDSVFRGNGALKAGGNIWLHAPRQATSTLTWVSAGTCTNCWNLTWGAQIDVQRVIYQSPAPDVELAEGTYDSLTAGQYADNGTNILQVRLSDGSNPNGKVIQAIMGYAAFVVEDSFLYDAQSSDDTHGWSIALDDETENGIIRRNYIAGAEGTCIAAVGGRNNRIESNVINGCGTATDHTAGRRGCIWLGEQHTLSTLIYNNTIHDCGRAGIQIGADGVTVNISSGVTLANNSFDDLETYGIVNLRNSVVTDKNSNIYNAAVSAVQDIGGNLTSTNQTTSNPLFSGGAAPASADGFHLSCNSTLRRTGTDVGRIQDYGNRAFAIGTPSIGAWEMASGDERCTVTSRSTITTRSAITPRTTIDAR